MDQTFYDSQGQPVAYMEDGTYLFLFSGEPIGYLDGESVYSYSGHHLGRFRSGWVRDNNGRTVFFSDQASGGPLRPLKQPKPLKGLKGLKPLKALKQLKPLKPLDSPSWSDLSGEIFFGA